MHENKFIVIEGLDGSGKSTQVKMLKAYLESNNIEYEYIHFPRTEDQNAVYGELVSRFLRGEFGKLDEVDPYLVALIYAGDRTDASNLINTWLSDGKTVVIDRYVYSNIAYQCSKTHNFNEQKKLCDWILNFEFDYNKIPKPDVSVFIDVPFEFTVSNLKSGRADDENRSYLKGMVDIHENDLSFQEKVRQMYLWQTETNDDFKILKCFDDENKMLKAEEVHARLIKLIGY